MDLAYRFDEKAPRPTIRLTTEDIFRLTVDGLHGLSAMAELFEGRRSYGDLSSEIYRAEIEERTKHSMILRSLMTVRDYAVDGLFPKETFHVGELLHDVFAFGYSQVRAFDFMTEFYGIPSGARLEPVRILLTTFIARWKLDVPPKADRDHDYVRDWANQVAADTETFSLGEIALLADMTERSVRNATQPRVPEGKRLRTVKQRYYVHVDREEAIRWLTNRRRFVRSTLPEGFPGGVFRPLGEKLGVQL